jgi:hypothetical protein
VRPAIESGGGHGAVSLVLRIVRHPRSTAELTIDDSRRAQLKLQAARAVGCARIERRAVGRRRGQPGGVGDPHTVAAGRSLPRSCARDLLAHSVVELDLRTGGSLERLSLARLNCLIPGVVRHPRLISSIARDVQFLDPRVPGNLQTGNLQTKPVKPSQLAVESTEAGWIRVCDADAEPPA